MGQPERKTVALTISNTFSTAIQRVMEKMAQLEGKGTDSKIIEALMTMHGKDMLILSHRILDELMIKEYKSHMHNINQDFTRIYAKDIFLKSIAVCAIESVLVVNMVRNITSQDILGLVQLKSFDYWRLMNSFLKFDP